MTRFVDILDEIQSVQIGGDDLDEQVAKFRGLTPEQLQNLLGRIQAETAAAERKGAILETTMGTLEVLLKIAKVLT
ncbi:MAG: hypothetical protein ACPG4T_23395 [Nannocystaceae bacterium]